MPRKHLPDELRCTGLTKNKKWRCSKHRANNSTYCEKHHHQHEIKNQKEAPQDELRCTKSSSQGWRCSNLRANDSTRCEHHRDASHAYERNRYQERKKQIEGAQDVIDATKQDKLRCTKADKRGWRCSKLRANDSKYCEPHHRSSQENNERKRKNREEGPQDELRCTMSSSKGWRCSNLRAIDSRYCEHHRDASHAYYQKQRNHYQERKKQIEGAQDDVIDATKQDELRCTKADKRGWRCSKLRANNSKYCEPHHRSSQENYERTRKNREEGAQDVVIAIAKKRPSNSANPK